MLQDGQQFEADVIDSSGNYVYANKASGAAGDCLASGYTFSQCQQAVTIYFVCDDPGMCYLDYAIYGTACSGSGGGCSGASCSPPPPPIFPPPPSPPYTESSAFRINADAVITRESVTPAVTACTANPLLQCPEYNVAVTDAGQGADFLSVTMTTTPTTPNCPEIDGFVECAWL